MSSPSRMNDMHEAHWPSLQPCMSMIPCSAAARRIVWSSPTSISMPTGSKRTLCLSGTVTSLRLPQSLPAGGLSRPPDPPGRLAPARGSFHGPVPDKGPSLSGGVTARGTTADVAGVERGALLVAHLVEDYVRRLERCHPAQVVERPHLLLVAQFEVRLRDHGLAVVADVAHVADHIGPVPAVVERLPLALADELAHVRRLAALVRRPEGRRVGPVARLRAVGAPLPVHLVHDHVLADEARDHAGPAAVRVDVVDVLGHDRVVPVRLRQAR